MSINSSLLDVFKRKAREKREKREKSPEVLRKNTLHELVYNKDFKINQNAKESFVSEIPHDEDTSFEVDYVQLVLMTKDRVVLTLQNNKWVFPIVDKELPSDKRYHEIVEQYSIENPRKINEPLLRSLFIVGDTDRDGILKSDIIQRHKYKEKIHPSVWGFFTLYPEYLGKDMLYSVRRINSMEGVEPKLLNYLIEYDAFVLQDDAERFHVEGQDIERRLGEVGYLNADKNVEILDNEITDFIKQYNKVNHLCIRIQGEKVIPIWIARP